MRYITLASFRHFHPDWEMRLHRCDTAVLKSPPWETGEVQEFLTPAAPRRCYLSRIDSLGVDSHEWSPPCEMLSPVHASDICCWDMLATVGGIYSDMDILYVAPVAVNREYDAHVCIVDASTPIGFLASSPNSPLFRDVFDLALTRQSPGYQSAGCEALMGRILQEISPAVRDLGAQPMRALFNALRRAFPSLRINNLDRNAVYPWWWDECLDIFLPQERDLPHNCFGIHWYAGARSSQQFNRTLDHTNFRDNPCVFSKYASVVWNE